MILVTNIQLIDSTFCLSWLDVSEKKSPETYAKMHKNTCSDIFRAL